MTDIQSGTKGEVKKNQKSSTAKSTDKRSKNHFNVPKKPKLNRPTFFQKVNFSLAYALRKLEFESVHSLTELHIICHIYRKRFMN